MAIDAGPNALTGLRLRSSFRNLEAQNRPTLDAFVNALRALMDFPMGDSRSYQHIAGIHGLPAPGLCIHRQLFFPWHRAYMLKLERALRTQNPNVALPWWDFSSAASLASGMPASFQSPADGGIDVLYSSRIEVDGDRHTRRNPRDAGLLPATALVEEALDQPNYLSFYNFYYPRIHNALHNWVRGDQLTEAYTAYDPIFWAYHCAIDRDWWRWQLRHPGSNPPALDFALPGVDMTVRETLDINALGYEYAAIELPLEDVA